MLPLSLLEQKAAEILPMEALHNHDDPAGALVIQARQQCAGVPIVDPLATRL